MKSLRAVRSFAALSSPEVGKTVCELEIGEVVDQLPQPSPPAPLPKGEGRFGGRHAESL